MFAITPRSLTASSCLALLLIAAPVAADQPAPQQAADKQAVDKQTADKQAVDKQAVDKQTVDKQTVDKQTVDKQTADKQAVVVVVGAAGGEEFAEPFRAWAKRWQEAAASGGAESQVIGLEEGGEADRRQLQTLLERQPAGAAEPLWLVLIGHGTFDGRSAKFNLRGPDVSAQELTNWLKPLTRPVAIINCASSSGPFINRLSGAGRVVVTSTKSGFEYNYARFGDHFSRAIGDPQADLDKDGQTSLLEAFLTASGRTAEFYEQEGRLATEHALLDDNGDQLGTPADWFRGVRATRAAKDGAEVDGMRAGQLTLVRSELEKRLAPEARGRRDQLEQQLAALRKQKKLLADELYYQQLEAIAIELAELYQASAEP